MYGCHCRSYMIGNVYFCMPFVTFLPNKTYILWQNIPMLKPENSPSCLSQFIGSNYVHIGLWIQTLTYTHKKGNPMQKTIKWSSPTSKAPPNQQMLLRPFWLRDYRSSIASQSDTETQPRGSNFNTHNQQNHTCKCFCFCSTPDFLFLYTVM